MIATLVLFAHLYGLGTDLPAYPEPTLYQTPVRFVHGATLETQTWHSLGLTGMVSSRWMDTGRGPLISSVDYRIGAFLKFGKVRLSAEHESDHNSDRNGRPLRGNYAGLDITL